MSLKESRFNKEETVLTETLIKQIGPEVLSAFKYEEIKGINNTEIRKMVLKEIGGMPMWSALRVMSRPKFYNLSMVAAMEIEEFNVLEDLVMMGSLMNSVGEGLKHSDGFTVERYIEEHMPDHVSVSNLRRAVYPGQDHLLQQC